MRNCDGWCPETKHLRQSIFIEECERAGAVDTTGKSTQPEVAAQTGSWNSLNCILVILQRVAGLASSIPPNTWTPAPIR